MKFKFSIRDILFVILLAAVSAAWITDRIKIAAEREEIMRKEIAHDSKVKATLRVLEAQQAMVESQKRKFDEMLESLRQAKETKAAQ